ncbi:gamma-soluble NSF attachment protein isoform X1 [Microplitis demolitor]|uniref:gamma-soluble NSF attachment protein isoform X1 n=1 Tax=Microplitis demolitor TaxID=69319 RepID=UPI0004CCA9D4|nr:gamma-soluble NSF attachment protein isoform X1 [Microplitis demolitor]
MAKVEEGNAHMRAAEKSLKTTLLKWRPDYEVAADEYNQAATCFRIAKSFKQCKEALIKAADCYKENKSWFHAAKSLEHVLLICRDMGDLSEIPQLAHRSCSLYQQHGSPESGATVLDKAGKMIESNDPEAALPLFQRAADIVLGEDSPRQAAEYLSRVARIFVKLKKFDEAANAIRREIDMHQRIEHQPSVGRLAVVLVLIQLARGDQVAAEKAFREWGNYCDAPEIQTLEMLLQAYDNEDANAARAALNSPFIKHMDVEYAKLARGLPLPQQEYAVPPAGVRANAAEPYVSSSKQEKPRETVQAEVSNETEPIEKAMASAKLSSELGEEEEETPGNPVEEKEENKEEHDEYDNGLC